MTLSLHVKGNIMVRQLAACLAALTMLVSSSGCSGMKNFLFGRGAACSTCATGAPTYGVAPFSEPACGREPACGYETASAAPFMAGGCSGSTCNGSPGCNCNSGMQSYMPSGFDSYAGNVHDPYAHSGEVIGSQVMGDSFNGYPAEGSVIREGMVPGMGYPSGSVQDNFGARSGGIMATPTPAPMAN